jgi:glycogen phosphorylase
MSFAEAANLIGKTNIFTTHTPVPAGNDEFPSG